MQRFPGRLPHEIDEADYGRIMRAAEVESIQALEAKRSAFLSGQGKKGGVKLTPDELKRVLEHDALVADAMED